MTKNATIQSKPKEDPDDHYDTLSQIDKNCHDFIAQNGYTPRFDGRNWTAESNNGGGEIGPVLTLPTLKTRVLRALKLAEKEVFGDGVGETDAVEDESNAVKVEPGTILEEGVIKLDADRKGNRYLPDMEEVVDPQLKDAAFEEYADKQAWKEAGKKKKESKARLDAVAATKKHLFYPDPENSGDLIYKVGGITVRMDKEITVKVKTEPTPDEDDE